MIVLRFFFASLVILFAENTVLARVEVGGVRPDGLLALVVYAGLLRGPSAGCLAGFFLGFLRDFDDPGMLGLSSLAGSLAGFLAGSLAHGVDRSHPLVQGFIVLAACLTYDLLRALVLSSVDVGLAVSMWWRLAVPGALYTAVAAPLVVALLPMLVGTGRLFHDRR